MEASGNPAAVRQRYLSAPEQAALAEFMAAAQIPASDAPPVDYRARITAMREGYAQFAAMAAPPLADLPGEPFSENGISGLWFKPGRADLDKALLFFHGGGYVMGSPDTGASIAGFLAKEAGIFCFAPHYPLAPEFPFPAALNSAVAAYLMLLDKGFRPENIVLGGDSAGGGLTLATLCELRDRTLPLPAGACLLSPWTDLTHSFSSHQTKRMEDTLLDKETLEFMAAMYAGGLDRKSPRISPAFADLRGLPPLLVQVGSCEILLDDALVVARNAALGHVPVTLAVWPGYGHVHQMTHRKFEGGRRALQDCAKFLMSTLEKTLLRPASQG